MRADGVVAEISYGALHSHVRDEVVVYISLGPRCFLPLYTYCSWDGEHRDLVGYGTPQSLLGPGGIPQTYDHVDEEGDIPISNTDDTEYKDQGLY